MQRGLTKVTLFGNDYYEAEDLTAPGPFIHERGYACYACGLTYRESKMVNFRGHWYGIPCTCYKDIKTLVRKESVDKRRSYTVG